MDDDCGRAGGLFRASFLERGLVTFAECAAHYDGFGSEQLLDELRLLLTPPMLAVPFAVSSARYYALMDALIQCAGTDRALSDQERFKLVNVCIDICVFLRGRAAQGRLAAFDTALATALDAVRSAALYPDVAQAIGDATHHFGIADEPPLQDNTAAASRPKNAALVIEPDAPFFMALQAS